MTHPETKLTTEPVTVPSQQDLEGTEFNENSALGR
jgi:hypothetical protein